ncbi:UpxY family transcription antiterminator [Pedobacter sp. HMF7647]|uniref:UpxY family transcription antiterminator n=1 Tax=Hufsiella arboris TaxID=2695275 RepID=A0A7K1Y530_9SPHI|nr:UpxY family transcription antiterminator [Hufsiella arboris]MXV49685.1 UpxY family transcription antiterminator [Hufsiella arboris]
MQAELKSNWYIIYTFPNLEKRIYNELVKKCIHAYLPMQRVIRQWSDRKKELQIPLFPNYVFINTTEKERFKLFNISGILKFISFEGKPAVVSEDEILQIKQFENTEFEVEPHLVQGDDVMIVKGPFTGMRGKLFSKRGKERFGIRLNSINQSLSLEISTANVRKV